MANRIIRDIKNSLQFYKDSPDDLARFNTRDMEDWFFSDTILPWQQQVGWCQPWQHSDTIPDQLQCNFGPVTLKLYTWDGGLVDTIPYNQVMQNFNDPEMFIYEVDVDMSGYPAGLYYFTIELGSPVVLILRSEKIILSEKIENTVLLECTQDTFKGDMIFETGIQIPLRLPGTKKYKGKGSKNTIYEDQTANQTLLRSVTHRIWTLSLGGSFGIPDAYADKVDEMLSCSTFLIDGKYYVKVDATLEPNEIDNYPMRAWSIDLREKTNRSSRIIDDNTPQNTQVSVMINTDGKGFGADTGGNETVIIDTF